MNWQRFFQRISSLLHISVKRYISTLREFDLLLKSVWTFAVLACNIWYGI